MNKRLRYILDNVAIVLFFILGFMGIVWQFYKLVSEKPLDWVDGVLTITFCSFIFIPKRITEGLNVLFSRFKINRNAK